MRDGPIFLIHITHIILVQLWLLYLAAFGCSQIWIFIGERWIQKVIIILPLQYMNVRKAKKKIRPPKKKKKKKRKLLNTLEVILMLISLIRIYFYVKWENYSLTLNNFSVWVDTVLFTRAIQFRLWKSIALSLKSKV